MAKSNKWEFSDKEIQRQIVAARKRDEIESPKEAAAVTAKIDKNGFIHLSFKDGFALTFPGSYIKELRTAKASEIVDLRLSPDGKAIYWPELDAHYTISGLLAGRFGNEAWMSELGKLGGTKTSVAKTIAARINGSKGGRPPIGEKVLDVHRSTLSGAMTKSSIPQVWAKKASAAKTLQREVARSGPKVISKTSKPPSSVSGGRGRKK